MSNYTKKMEAELASEKMTYDRAVALATQWGLSVKSVIAKTKSLGIDYTPKPRATRKTSGITKADLVRQIESKLNLELDGLQNASASALTTLLGAL